MVSVPIVDRSDSERRDPGQTADSAAQQRTELIPRYTDPQQDPSESIQKTELSSDIAGPPTSRLPTISAHGPVTATASPAASASGGPAGSSADTGVSSAPQSTASPSLTASYRSSVAETAISPPLSSMLSNESGGDAGARRFGETERGRTYGGDHPRVRGTQILVILGTLLLLVPVVALLYRSAFQEGAPSPAGVIGGSLAMAGLSLLAAGVYPFLSGSVPGLPDDFRALLRPPSAFLVIGVVLLISAGLAAS